MWEHALQVFCIIQHPIPALILFMNGPSTLNSTPTTSITYFTYPRRLVFCLDRWWFECLLFNYQCFQWYFVPQYAISVPRSKWLGRYHMACSALNWAYVQCAPILSCLSVCAYPAAWSLGWCPGRILKASNVPMGSSTIRCKINLRRMLYRAYWYTSS